MDRELIDRIIQYEETYKICLNYGTPKIIRVDMRAGKTFTKELQKPFDKIFSSAMIETMKSLCSAIPGAKIGYTQSDEISIVIKDVNKENQEVAFFNNSLTKIVSNVASMATLFFNINWDNAVFEFCKDNGIDINDAKINGKKYEVLQPYFDRHLCGLFDCRYFELSNEDEIANYLQYRQEDCYRNSVNQIARTNFTQTELNKISTEDKIKMLENAGIPLNQFPLKYFKGEICYKVPEERIGVQRFTWKAENAPNFYNNVLFVKGLYKGE